MQRPRGGDLRIELPQRAGCGVAGIGEESFARLLLPRIEGGEILMGPMEVPGGAFVVNAKDPQGGYFAFLGQRG